MGFCPTDCGNCCDPVWPAKALPDIARALADPYLAGALRREYQKIHDMLTKQGVSVDAGRVQTAYSCKHFDRETRRCTDYANRPQMCSGFPWYGKEPRPGVISNMCAYQEDLHTMLPIVAVTSGGRQPVPAS